MTKSGRGSEGASLRAPSSRIFLNMAFGSPMRGRNYRRPLIELDRIDVEMPTYFLIRFFKEIVGQGSQKPLKRGARGGLHQYLGALEARAARDDVCHGIEHAYFLGRG